LAEFYASFKKTVILVEIPIYAFLMDF